MKLGQPMICAHDDAWRLAAGSVLRLMPAAHGRWLAATGGRLWLTRSGAGAVREADVWLQPGERLWLGPGSDWLIEAWGEGAFVLLQAPPSPCADPAPLSQRGRSAPPAGRGAPRAPSAPRFPWLRPAASSS